MVFWSRYFEATFEMPSGRKFCIIQDIHLKLVEEKLTYFKHAMKIAFLNNIDFFNETDFFK